MNSTLAKYLFYYPSTLLKGEFHCLHIANYNKFQYQSPDVIEAYQKEKLIQIVKVSMKRKPFYRDLYREIDIARLEGLSLPQLLSALPTIEKSTLIEHIDEMTGHISFFTSSKTTGGSTGEPVVINKNPDALARERVATARSYAWADIHAGDMQARFWGVPHSKSGQFKAILTDIAANRLRISAFDLSLESLHEYYNKMRLRKPVFLYGYVSVIRLFSDFICDNRLDPIPSIKAIITTSEVLSDADKKFIESVWGVKVFNEYGCGEVGSIAHACENGSMHVMADNLILEVDTQDSSSKSGELIVTDLHNVATPLIRYRLGDFAELSNELCGCGRTLPILKGIYGRAYDLIETPEGRSLHPESVIYIFETIQSKIPVIKQFQVVQTKKGTFILNIVPRPDFQKEHASIITGLFREHISTSAELEIRIVKEIAREKSGKLRLVKRQ